MTDAVLQPSPAAVAVAIGRIVQAVRPSRIIAFGSRARGEHRCDSDVDLLVVLARPAQANGISGDVYEAVGAVGFSKDILISDEERLKRGNAAVGSVESEAEREGVVLYENGRTDRTAIEKICR